MLLFVALSEMKVDVIDKKHILTNPKIFRHYLFKLNVITTSTTFVSLIVYVLPLKFTLKGGNKALF